MEISEQGQGERKAGRVVFGVRGEGDDDSKLGGQKTLLKRWHLSKAPEKVRSKPGSM